MYIEVWQLWSLLFVAIAAYFSYKSGWREGFKNGIHLVITDLHQRHMISKYEDEESGEISVGRYDEDPREEPNKRL